MSPGRDPVTPAAAEAPSVTAPGKPTLIPAPPALRQLTSGGCCTQPFWSADSRYVQFVDRPASRPAGIYGVDLEAPGPPLLMSEWIVSLAGDGDFYVYPDGNSTVVQRVATGERHVIDNGGRPVSLSPDGQRLLWQVIDRRGDFDQRRSQTWVANVDGSQARVVGETVGLGESLWIDPQRILLVGLPLQDRPAVALAALTLGTGEGADSQVELAQVNRPRGALLSPAGAWLVYYVTFQSDPGDDGLWVVPTDGTKPPRKLNFFGGYRWRDEAHLLYVLLAPGVASHTLWEYDLGAEWEYDLGAEESRPLIDPAQTPFKIANNDWAVSPDGRYVTFVSAADHNLWLIDLAP